MWPPPSSERSRSSRSSSSGGESSADTKDHVRDLGGEGGDRGIGRIDEEQVGVDVVPDDPFEDRALALIRLDGEYEWHVD